MSISGPILQEAQSLAEPISAAAPSGQNPASNERYQELRLEVDKENSPSGETVRWANVVTLGQEVLRTVAKDLLVAAYTTFAMYRTRGLEGLAVGLAMVDLLLEHHWDGMFPPVARLKGRGTAMRWLLEHIQGAMASYTPVVSDRAAIADLIAISRNLRGRAREKLGDHVPPFKDWTDLLESMRLALPAEAATPPASTPAVAPTPPPVAAPVAATPAAPPSPPAGATPAATPAADGRSVAAAWLEPIPGSDPAGSDATASEPYQALLAEVDKLQSPSGGTVDWPLVIRHGDEILRKQVKDMRVACHVALGRYRVDGLAGLVLGLAIVAELTDAFWETMQPPLKRIRGRLGAVRGLLDQVEPELAGLNPNPSDAPHLAPLKATTKRFQAVLRERFGDQAPVLRLLIQTIEQLEMTIAAAAPPVAAPTPPAAAPPSSPSPSPSSPPSSPSPSPSPPPPAAASTAQPAAAVAAPGAVAAAPDASKPAAVDRYLRGVGEELVKLAKAMRQAQDSDPMAYRLLRTGLWIYIAAPPPSQADGATQIPGVSDRDRSQLTTFHDNGRWAELLDLSESLLPAHRFVIDLHRYTAAALAGLGHEAARKAVLAEVGSFVARLPQVIGFKDRAGVALADDATKAWLAREVQGSGGGGAPAAAAIPIAAPVAAAPPGAEFAQVQALLSANKREDALRFISQQLAVSGAGRDKFVRRLELAEACLAAKDLLLARTLFAGLSAEVDNAGLAQWEPSLAARCFDGLARSIPRGQAAEKPAFEAAVTRLAGLDPARAGSLVARGS